MKLTGYQKNRIESQCQPLIEKLKSQYVLKNPDKRYNYMVDIYIKWYRNYLYFCGKYKSENPDRLVDEFEGNFARLKIIKPDSFEISYMRHTEKWFIIARDLTLNKCLEMIEDTPTFHPV
jgi:hypothetical protein